MRLYETIFIVAPDVDDTGLEEIIQGVRSFIESSGGTVKHVDLWGRKKLAYEVRHHREGYFVYLVFEAPGELVARLYRQYQIMDGVIKSIVVRFEGDLEKIRQQQGGPPLEAGTGEAEVSSAVPVTEEVPSTDEFAEEE